MKNDLIANYYTKQELQKLQDSFEIESRFGYAPWTEEEHEAYAGVQEVTLQQGNMHELVNNIVNEVSLSSPELAVMRYGLAIDLDDKHYTDYMKEKSLLPVYIPNYEKPLFYYDLNNGDVNITMEQRDLTDFSSMTLSDVLTLTIPSQSYLSGVDVPNMYTYNSWDEKSQELMEKLPIITTPLELQVATYLSDNAPYDDRGGEFGAVFELKGRLATYYYSMVNECYDEYSSSFEDFDPSYDFDVNKFEELCVNKIKDDLLAGDYDLSESQRDFYRSINYRFNSRSEEERFSIYKMTALTSESLQDNLMTVLAENVLKHALDVDNQPLENNPAKFKEKVEDVKDFLMETTVSDLEDSSFNFDINSANLEDGVPLLSLIAEFGDEFNIKFKDDIPKLSDLTRETVEVTR